MPPSQQTLQWLQNLLQAALKSMDLCSPARLRRRNRIRKCRNLKESVSNGVRALLSYATGVMEPHPPDPALKVAPTSAHIVLYSWAWSRFRFWAWASTWANEPSPRNNGHKTWPQERSGSGRSLKHYS
uniref:HDC12883 n=1 Tax=Drosophila melanogaster TaxID=7227 RepID=Q6IKC3_DROME|nr:TPA_inf: HDC12883 [Drosophila melanogaster]